jgi:hypothetical protein
MSIPSAHPCHRRAVSIVAILVAMPLCLGCAVLAIDVGQLCVLRAEMQTTADAGALAGAGALRLNQWASVEAWALEMILSNQVTQGFNSLDDQIIELGRWEKATRTFSALDPANAASANAVHVVSVRDQAPLFFATGMGLATTNVSREAIALVTPSCGGIWGLDSVTVPGSVWIDSYDSTQGPYTPGSATENGDLCSNGNITVSGSANVYGDALADAVVITGGAAYISGIVEEAIDDVPIPVLDFSDVATNNDNATIPLTDNGFTAFNAAEKNLRIPSGDNLTLAPGTYYMKNIRFDSPSTLTLTGPTEIYMTGYLDGSSSGTINTTQNPHDLLIMSSGSEVNMSGNAQFYGAILAPNAAVTLTGNADYFGAVIGRTVEFGGSFQFHLDDSIDIIEEIRGPLLLVQ